MRGQQLKSYCKGLRIDEAFVARAYDQWAHARAGRKNAWRVTDEHGSSQALVSEIARARRVTSYWGWFCQSDSASVVRCNGFGGIARHARALIGAYERSMYEHDNTQRYAA